MDCLPIVFLSKSSAFGLTEPFLAVPTPMVVLGLGLSESFRFLLTSVKENGMMWECDDAALVLS